MAKARSYSIFLLKQEFSSQNSIKDPSKLTEEKGTKLPDNATLFVLNAHYTQPWWKSDFGIQKDLNQILQGALVFLPCSNRVFVLSFGPGFHHLKEESYEYDFGLLASLNSVDPKKLKSTDTLDPSGARRRRTQLPIASDLTAFDIDRDISILKNLTGTAKDSFKSNFKQVTGSSSLRISSRLTPKELVDLCRLCLRLYDSKNYLKSFPDIQNIVPLRDPAKLKQLNLKLLSALHLKSLDVALTIPDIIEYRDHSEVAFSGRGKGKSAPDATITNYYTYLEQHKTAPSELTLENLKTHCVELIDSDGNSKNSYSIFNSLLYETTIDQESKTYHLTDGSWYAVETSYTEKLKNYLDPLCETMTLPDYEHESEGKYNLSVPGTNSRIICLDTTSIHPSGQKSVEPCDLYCVNDDRSNFFHVKISTRSSLLSHLFNQGINAIELLRTEEESMKKLKSLIFEKASNDIQKEYIEQLAKEKFKVIFSIVTHKDTSKKSDNLPLFSRISLYRTLRALQSMGVERSFGFIKDKTAV